MKIGDKELASPSEHVRDPKTHELKLWPEYFQAVLECTKRYERREVSRQHMGREFLPGDTLFLREFDPCRDCEGTGFKLSSKGGTFCSEKCSCGSSHGAYTGRELYVKVLYVSDTFCVTGREPHSYEDHVIMSISEPVVYHQLQPEVKDSLLQLDGTFPLRCTVCGKAPKEPGFLESCPGRPRIDPRDEDDG